MASSWGQGLNPLSNTGGGVLELSPLPPGVHMSRKLESAVPSILAGVLTSMLNAACAQQVFTLAIFAYKAHARVLELTFDKKAYIFCSDSFIGCQRTLI